MYTSVYGHTFPSPSSSPSPSPGLSIQGVYRISSAKSKLDKLCQLFESGADRIDLSEVPPHLVGSCLKFYFRQVKQICHFDIS